MALEFQFFMNSHHNFKNNTLYNGPLNTPTPPPPSQIKQQTKKKERKKERGGVGCKGSENRGWPLGQGEREQNSEVRTRLADTWLHGTLVVFYRQGTIGRLPFFSCPFSQSNAHLLTVGKTVWGHLQGMSNYLFFKFFIIFNFFSHCFLNFVFFTGLLVPSQGCCV